MFIDPTFPVLFKKNERSRGCAHFVFGKTCMAINIALLTERQKTRLHANRRKDAGAPTGSPTAPTGALTTLESSLAVAASHS